MVSSFHPHSMCNKVERVKEKLDDFVYKTDNLFRNIRVSDKNSSVTKAFHFVKTYFNSRLFVHSVCTIPSDVINFQHVLTSFVVF